MKTLRYLAYGSNLYPRRLQYRVPSARVIGTVGLTGWQLNFHKRGQDASAKCNIIQTGEIYDVVYGAVYEMLVSERNKLDKVEGLNRGYNLAQIEIVEQGTAFFYLAEEEYIDNDLLPFDWYKKLVVAGGRFHAFPKIYLAQINRVNAMPDFDDARHQHHMAILTMS
ncbi:MAG: gamma-glutamylcyclotransferase [Halobacteria archaeon]|nr:gamma-glutamylcyclotransferase [Halobacteria archaeon]